METSKEVKFRGHEYAIAAYWSPKLAEIKLFIGNGHRSFNSIQQVQGFILELQSFINKVEEENA